MQRVVVITYERRTAQNYADQLANLFHGYASVEPYSLEDNTSLDVEADVVIASTHSIYSMVRKHARHCRNILFADLTFRKETLESLRTIPKGTKAMLVNSTMEMAVQTISLIHSAGISHIELSPVYPEIADTPDYSIAITPGEIQLVPCGVREIIDLGARVLSMRTIINVAAKTNLSALLQTPKFEAYFQSLVQSDFGLGKLMEHVSDQEKQLDLIMRIFSGGVLTVSGEGVITSVNKTAENLLGKSGSLLTGLKLTAVLPELDGLDLSRMATPLEDKIITVCAQLTAVSVYPVARESVGGIVLMKSLSDVEREQLKIRRQILAKGHVAKYTFDDIVGESDRIFTLKRSAGRMARSASSVLIYGQSGVGKELFAQSIHNASDRSEYPFIAINCASISETLLESELFGYSEGAFTGAKKGGKPGYFELAHKGTLFLDEVGEMSLSLQAKLLRVLQEKAAIRVGGDSVINVDVRIIAASNKKLRELVRRNLFREDLYYRLNVLSLEIPPLSERREDIPLLIRLFRDKLQGRFEIAPEAMELIQGCRWNGNVRELQNFVERLTCLDQRTIRRADAAVLIDEEPAEPAALEKPEEQARPLMHAFLDRERQRLPRHRSILELLAENGRGRKKMGRSGISGELERRGVFLSPQEVRTIVKTLQSYGFVNVMPGRGGTEIALLGRQLLSLLQK